MMVSISPATKRRTIKKIEPVTIPITTQPIIILGPTTEGLGISARVSRVLCRCGCSGNTFDHVGDAILVFVSCIPIIRGVETYISSDSESTLKKLQQLEFVFKNE